MKRKFDSNYDLWKVKFNLDIWDIRGIRGGYLTQVDAQTSVRAAYCIRRISFVSPSGKEWSLDLILFSGFVLL